MEYVVKCEQISLHVGTRKLLGPSEIYVLQRSKPDVFQILNVAGQTLRLILPHINQV